MFKITLLSKQSFLGILKSLHLNKINFPFYGENLLLFLIILILSVNLKVLHLNTLEVVLISLSIAV